MKSFKVFLLLTVPELVSACAIHPLPENFSRSSTYDIVQKIRCEARGAIVEIALSDTGRSQIEPFLSEPLVKTEAKQVRTERARRLLVPAMQRAAIGYSFRFSITEDNDASGSARFEFPFSNGSFALGLSTGEDKRRKSDRSFDLVEDFAQVLADPTLHCGPGGEDWKYPITGDIGLEEVIKTYVRLADLQIFPQPRRSNDASGAADDQLGVGPSGRAKAGGGGSGSSGGRQKGDATSTPSAPSGPVKAGGGSSSSAGGQGRASSRSSGQGREIYEFTDELTFTTSFNASAQPSLQLKPVVHDFRLTQASASIGGSREDVHSVTIALKAPTADTAARGLALERFVPPVGERGLAPLGVAPGFPGAADPKGDVLTTLQNKKNRELVIPPN